MSLGKFFVRYITEGSSRYFVSGRITETISIGLTTGELRTIGNGAFDYERQTEVFIQVQARDNLQTDLNEQLHSTFTQVRIEVIDVNDETPILIMVSSQRLDFKASLIAFFAAS